MALSLTERVRRALNSSPIALGLTKDVGTLSPERFLDAVFQAALRRAGTSVEALESGGLEEPEGVSLSMNSFSTTPTQQALRARQERRNAEAGKAGADAFFEMTGSGH